METPMEETEGNALQGLDSKATQRVDVSISPHPKPSRVDVSVPKPSNRVDAFVPKPPSNRVDVSVPKLPSNRVDAFVPKPPSSSIVDVRRSRDPVGVRSRAKVASRLVFSSRVGGGVSGNRDSVRTVRVVTDVLLLKGKGVGRKSVTVASRHVFSSRGRW